MILCYMQRRPIKRRAAACSVTLGNLTKKPKTDEHAAFDTVELCASLRMFQVSCLIVCIIFASLNNPQFCSFVLTTSPTFERQTIGGHPRTTKKQSRRCNQRWCQITCKHQTSGFVHGKKGCSDHDKIRWVH